MPSVPSDQKIGICHETKVRSVAVDVGEADGEVYTSKLTFSKATPGHSGTYQCVWKWEGQSGCLKVNKVIMRCKT